MDGTHLVPVQGTYETVPGHGMPKTWGRTSFSGINRKLDKKNSFSGKNNGFAAFPKGTVAGDFLHKLIEKAVKKRITVKDGADEALRAFIANEMKGKAFFAGKRSLTFQRACLERLGYREEETPNSYSEYCERWIGNCLRLLLTRTIPVTGGNTGIDLSALIRSQQVVPEIDFLLKVPGDPENGWNVGSIVRSRELAGLSLETGTSSAEESLKGYMTGQIDLLLKNTDGRYWVIDWKSNAIDTEDSCDNPRNYTRQAMEKVMDEHHYRLQALCYTVALFRYLQLRNPEKASDEVLGMIGGAIYVFLRGVDEADGNLGIFCMPMERLKDSVIALNGILSGRSGTD